MRNRNRTPLRVPIVAAFVAILVSFLFGGVTQASDETSLQSAAAQSASITTEAQPSSDGETQ